MAYRPNIYSRRELDQRHEGWPPSNRKGIVYNRNQQNNPSKFYSKTLICRRKPHIKLFCPVPSCHTRCLTFADYKTHLHTDKHIRAMRKRIVEVNRVIEDKRTEQAEAQAVADRAAKIHGTSSAVVKHCPVCDLHFYQEESKHIASKLHAVLQELLTPKCNICPYQSKDAEDYENHICSLEHLKREDSWTAKVIDKSHDVELEDIPKSSSDNKTEDAPTSSKDNTCEPSTSKEAMPIQTMSTEEMDELSKNSVNPNCDQEDVFFKPALFCMFCNLYFHCEEGEQAAKVKHCNTQQHLELWVKHTEGNWKPQDSSKE